MKSTSSDMQNFFAIIEHDTANTIKNAHRAWTATKRNLQSAQTCGLVTLFSYSNPSRETAPKDSLRSHFSPSILYMRLKHAYERNILYIDSGGIIFKPALAINLINANNAHQVLQAIRSLTPDYFPGLSRPWRIAIKCFTFITSIHRRIAGEKVLANFCARDRSYFGTIFVRKEIYTMSVHCAAIPASIAIQHLKSFVLTAYRER